MTRGCKWHLARLVVVAIPAVLFAAQSVGATHSPHKAAPAAHARHKHAKATPKQKQQNKGKGSKQTGKASWYGRKQAGKKTASGERFDPAKMTAAHPTLPLGSKAKVTNLENGKSTEVKVNDRGPYVKGRKIDLSRAAAQKIGMKKHGVVKVKIEPQPPNQGDGAGGGGDHPTH